MGQWRSIATGSVREPDLRKLLADAGTSWEAAAHVTATTSLASAMRSRTSSAALPVATLLDLVALPGHPDGHALPLDAFPRPALLAADPAGYREAMDQWQAVAGGRRFRIAFDMSRSLRAFVKSGAVDPAAGRLLIDARRDLARTVVALNSAGVEPGDLAPPGPVGRAAVQAWAQMEADVPAMTTLRRTLWIDEEDLRPPTADATGALRRVGDALAAAFGPAGPDGRRTLVHHGFYFFTPAQWALFQLMRELPGIDQIFVLHDDGSNPAFKTWRLFFAEHDWRMPPVEGWTPSGGTTLAAAAYAGAMVGVPVDAAAIGADVALLRYRNPAEFVRDWRRSTHPDQAGQAPVYYAANAESASRLVRRLDRDATGGKVDLSELPVGLFLLAVHGSIDNRPGQPPRVRLTDRAVTDIVGSGFLDVTAPEGVDPLAVVRRAMPFFKGCDDGHHWAERARALQRLVRDEVAALGAKNHGHTDAERIAAAAGNPLRLVPWADLSVDEADTLFLAVAAAVAVVQETAANEELSLSEHLAGLRGRLERGLKALPAAEAAEVMSKFHGFSDVGDAQVDVADLIDVVRMILGRHPDFDPDGSDPERDLVVKELRSLDTLGFERSARPLHLANLADGAFPSPVPRIGWPFAPKDLQGEQCRAEPVALEILETRAVHAGQSDLYLLWLALDGASRAGLDVPADTPCAVLSWIEEMNGDLLSPSSLMSLIARPTGVPDGLADFVGGVPVGTAAASADPGPLRAAAEPVPAVATAPEIAAAAEGLDRAAAASAVLCRRRFALQWAVGDSATFRSPHHHAMLYGNVIAALQRLGLRSRAQAQRVCDDLWRHLTDGERSSSALKAVINPDPARRSAEPPWLLTLEGRGKGNGINWRKRDRPVDRSYQAAVDPDGASATVIAEAADGFLPAGVDDHAVCRGCPVKDRCLVASIESR